MAGFEQIVLSRVRKVSGGYTFSALRDREKPIRHRRSSAAELFASGAVWDPPEFALDSPAHPVPAPAATAPAGPGRPAAPADREPAAV